MSDDCKVMYGISRVDDDVYRIHAWRVSLRRRGKGHVKNFPDKKYGSKRKALRSAKMYRDEIVDKYPPITRKEFSSILRSNNNSGTTGVYKYAKKYMLADGREVEKWYWEAHWPTERGKYRSVNFSVDELGEDIARARALRARKNGLNDVEGVFWVSERGDRSHAITQQSANESMPLNESRSNHRRA